MRARGDPTRTKGIGCEGSAAFEAICGDIWNQVATLRRKDDLLILVRRYRSGCQRSLCRTIGGRLSGEKDGTCVNEKFGGQKFGGQHTYYGSFGSARRKNRKK